MHRTWVRPSAEYFCGVEPLCNRRSQKFGWFEHRNQGDGLALLDRKCSLHLGAGKCCVIGTIRGKTLSVRSMRKDDSILRDCFVDVRESRIGNDFSTRNFHERNGFSNANFFASTSVSSPPPPPSSHQMALIDRALLFLGFIACAVSGALAVLIFTAIPTLRAMKKAAIELEKLAEATRSELPTTMAAIRLSGMEISDLTMELSDLSQEISEGVKSSARAVQAAEEGLKRMSNFASSQTIAILQERASVPVEAVKPAVANAAKKTKMAVQQVRKVVKQISTVNDVSGWITKELKKRAQLNPTDVKHKKETRPSNEEMY